MVKNKANNTHTQKTHGRKDRKEQENKSMHVRKERMQMKKKK